MCYLNQRNVWSALRLKQTWIWTCICLHVNAWTCAGKRELVYLWICVNVYVFMFMCLFVCLHFIGIRVHAHIQWYMAYVSLCECLHRHIHTTCSFTTIFLFLHAVIFRYKCLYLCKYMFMYVHVCMHGCCLIYMYRSWHVFVHMQGYA